MAEVREGGVIDLPKKVYSRKVGGKRTVGKPTGGAMV